MENRPGAMVAQLIFAALLGVSTAWAESPATPDITAAPTQSSAEAEALKQQAKEIRNAADQRYLAEEKACHQRFMVTDCLDKARKARIPHLQEARRLEAEARRIEREIRRADARQREESQASDSARREASLPEREAEVEAAQKAHAERVEAIRRDKAAKAEEGARRHAEREANIARKQAAHEAKVAEKMKAARPTGTD